MQVQGLEQAGWRSSSHVGVLEQLRGSEVSLVSWHRSLPPLLADQLTTWASRYPAEFDRILSLPNYDLSAATHGLPDSARAWLTLDIALLLARLAGLADARQLRVSFGAVRADQCPKFHVDYLRYRLITTYLGPGTEWLPDSAVRQEALDHSAECPCDANKEIVRDARAVRHAVAGEVLVMKGGRHPSSRGAVHRSPPIEASGRIRVVLIASTVDDS